MWIEDSYIWVEDEHTSTLDVERFNKFLGLTFLFCGCLLLLTSPVFASDIKLRKKILEKMEDSTSSAIGEENFRKLYTTIDFRSKPVTRNKLHQLQIVDTAKITVEAVRVRSNSVTIAEETVAHLGKVFKNRTTGEVVLAEIVESIPITAKKLTYVRELGGYTFLNVRGGAIPAMVGQFLLGKGAQFAKNAFQKLVSPDQKQKLLDHLNSRVDNQEAESQKNYLQTLPQGVLLLLSVIVLFSITRGDTKKVLGDVKDKLGEIIFPPAKKSWLEEKFDRVINSLKTLLNPTRPYFWLLFVLIAFYFNFNVIKGAVIMSDARFFGGKISEQADKAMNTIRTVIDRAEISREKYQLNAEEDLRSQKRENLQTLKQMDGVKQELSDFKILLAKDQVKLKQCESEIRSFIEEQNEYVDAYKKVSDSTSLIEMDPNHIANTFPPLKRKEYDNRYQAELIPDKSAVPAVIVEVEKKKGFFNL